MTGSPEFTVEWWQDGEKISVTGEVTDWWTETVLLDKSICMATRPPSTFTRSAHLDVFVINDTTYRPPLDGALTIRRA